MKQIDRSVDEAMVPDLVPRTSHFLGVMDVVNHDDASVVYSLRNPVEVSYGRFEVVVCVHENKIQSVGTLEESGKGTINIADDEFDILSICELERQCGDIRHSRRAFERIDAAVAALGQVEGVNSERGAQLHNDTSVEVVNESRINR